ncbi:MAG TPA: hypothetical protein VNI61_00535 [Gemmatimonadales bacterium]|nr:hypothetical protein [Gemmatimonadales bacterium]
MPGLRWGRLQLDVDCHLRRGAWYRVVELQGMQAVVDVNQRPLPVPRYALEVVSTPPKRWSVVPAPRNAAKLPREFTPRYAVCPNCRERQPLRDRARTLRCGRCRGVYEVAWNEGYLLVY